MNMPLESVPFGIVLDRTRSIPLADQISSMLKAAIVEGRLQPEARLPSWLDMATHLGVARGTVKAAYEKLVDEELVVSAGAGGTRVARMPAPLPPPPQIEIKRPLQGIVRGYSLPPLPFQMGVPAQDLFPYKLWARIRTRAVRDDAMGAVGQSDPRGTPELRTQIASYLAIARGIRCLPDQIILTNGYRNGLALALRTLGVQGRSVWMEEPGYPITRMGLELDGMKIVPVPVDADGMVVEEGLARARDAALAIVTPGQQAPTGVTLSAARRQALLKWAADNGSWIIEDDYLSDLQLCGRAAPALAATDPAERVIHIGSFGKTLSPALGLGFLIAPVALAERFGEVAACLQPAPNTTSQLALAGFIADGHYLRHLRRMKQIYTERRDALLDSLRADFPTGKMAGLAFIMHLPKGTDDAQLAQNAPDRGIAPMPLSAWWHDQEQAARGLLLGVTNLKGSVVSKACQTLRDVVRTTI